MKKANFNKKKLSLRKKTILFLNEKSLSFMQGGIYANQDTSVKNCPDDKTKNRFDPNCESVGCASAEDCTKITLTCV